MMTLDSRRPELLSVCVCVFGFLLCIVFYCIAYLFVLFCFVYLPPSLSSQFTYNSCFWNRAPLVSGPPSRNSHKNKLNKSKQLKKWKNFSAFDRWTIFSKKARLTVPSVDFACCLKIVSMATQAPPLQVRNVVCSPLVMLF